VNVVDEFDQHREDLEALLVEVLGALLGADEVMPGLDDPLAAGPLLTSQLAIYDRDDGSYTVVEIQTPVTVGRVIAAQMMGLASPSPEDLLDAIAELGNIIAGNVKSLVRHSCRLSLPLAEVLDGVESDRGSGVRVAASVLGNDLHLTVRPARTGEPGPKVYWPGSEHDEMQEIEL
jgi:chemotaxis protein CheX